ncbi:MAG: mannose-6-phosphate isomerase, class I [Treponema sp.]|nr:mannose-6-phosphate isomerase, class I [Treponema sp.]
MGIHKLENTVKHYAWGSPEWIPRLTASANPRGEPWAELWMGVHPGGPSRALLPDPEHPGKTLGVPLAEIAAVPFLLKFLAAESPLSIQAHPNAEQAREGFDRENAAGIAPDAPERNYRDGSHKPEILCALPVPGDGDENGGDGETPFTAMAGFREPGEAAALLEGLAEAAGDRGTGIPRESGVLWNTLRAALSEGYRPFLSALFGLSEAERKALTAAVTTAAARAATPGTGTAGGTAPDKTALELCGAFAAAYPDDPGILSPLYLNVLTLRPFEGIYIPAGVLHAYVRGLGVECMANSDNVLRGGLTPKHVDLGELLSILRFEPFRPAIVRPVPVSPGRGRYESAAIGGFAAVGGFATEFSLYLLRGPEAALEADAPGEAIVAAVQGAARIRLEPGGEECFLRRGESAFVRRRGPGERVLVRGAEGGECSLFAALDPAPNRG